jgi:hypothetical protein
VYTQDEAPTVLIVNEYVEDQVSTCFSKCETTAKQITSLEFETVLLDFLLQGPSL